MGCIIYISSRTYLGLVIISGMEFMKSIYCGMFEYTGWMWVV